MEMKCTFQSTRAPFQCAWWFPNSIYWTLKEPIVLRIPNSLASLRSIRHLELKSVGSLYNVFEIHRKEVNSSLLEVKAMNKDTEADSDSDRKIKEEERRRKIGLANRGKVPWNKGRKHSEGRRIFSSIFCIVSSLRLCVVRLLILFNRHSKTNQAENNRSFDKSQGEVK